MRDVAVWLDELGLGKYAKIFADNEVDLAALPHITESMLERMGLPIGARAKLLAAIAQMPARKAAAAPPAVDGERRQISVVFCDIVDSTRLARRLDPEDLQKLVLRYQAACRSAVELYGGYVAQYLGDGVMAYFGWPAAHEDAAEQAVRAGLEIVQAVKAIEGPEKLSVRVGINTGVVVISGNVEDRSRPWAAVGDTPHVAAHLQALASPDTVVIAEATSRLISGRFDQESLGPKAVKGLEEPITVYRVMRARDDSGRFQAAGKGTLTPLVDRRTELALLQQRWAEAKDGEGQVVFISGIAGVGKSRIVHELERTIDGGAHFSLHFQCLPHCMRSPLFPVIQQMEKLARLAPEDSDDAKLGKLERLLKEVVERVDDALPLVAEMMSIPTGTRYPRAGQTSLHVKVQTLLVLMDLLVGLSARRPVFCLVEDAQWIDPSTQELVDLLTRHIGEARILLLVTHRPEYQPKAASERNTSAITISRLRRRDVADMAELLLRDQPLAPAVMERIIDDSDSIPLFVEELARSAIESAMSGSGDAQSPSAVALPSTLRDSLVARLDRAPQARNVAQMAAVVGREFSYDMLRHVSSMSPDELDAGLEHLQQSEIVQPLGGERPGRYAFKHALLRDAAYESLLKSNRKEIHAKVASAIEREWPETVSAQPELLAYHYGLAGNAELAVQYWLQGGQRARSRSANVEAMSQFLTALEFLQFLPDSPQRAAIELEVQLSLGFCSIAARGYSADDTRRAFERARTLSATLGRGREEMQAIFGLWGHYWMQARHDRAIELGETLLAKAELVGDGVALAVAHRSLGSTLFTFGDLVKARTHLERAIAFRGSADSGASPLSFAVDPRLAAQLLLAWDLWILGYPDSARRAVEQGLLQAGHRADPYTNAFANYVTSAVHLLRGEVKASLEHAERSLALSVKHGINLYALYSRFGCGCALAGMGRMEEAIHYVREGIEEARRSKLGYMHAFMLGWLASLQAQTGDAESASASLDEAFRHIGEVAGRTWEAELWRLSGDVVLAAHPDALQRAEESYRQAIAVAQRQQARSLELRAATSLARVLQRRGEAAEARRTLASAYGWFTEGFDTADLRAARTLLEALE